MRASSDDGMRAYESGKERKNALYYCSSGALSRPLSACGRRQRLCAVLVLSLKAQRKIHFRSRFVKQIFPVQYHYFTPFIARCKLTLNGLMYHYYYYMYLIIIIL